MKRNTLKLLTLLSLSALPLGTVACSKGSSSPTEPAFDLEQSSVAASTDSLSVTTDESRGRGRGGDDNSGDDRSGRRGGDDNGADDRGGRRGGRNGDDDNPRAPRAPRNGQEFEGSVASVSGNTVILTTGTRILVNGQTRWIAGGDLNSLAQISRAVAADRPTRVEGRGVRQGNGNFVANTIKAEVDD
ncbi:MAG TPA: hypothetical protein VJ725_03240 [Thermoanaerobaculia bacterium]|nr:hypothetical protein [Thermoanaerobaculia bacterium]